MAETSDSYISFTEAQTEIGDDAFSVRVHWARIGGQMRVVGVDLRSFYVQGEALALQEHLGTTDPWPLSDPWKEFNTSVLRGLRFAEVVEESRQELLADLKSAAQPLTIGIAGERAAISGSLESKRRPGPSAVITDEHLESIVAPAYLNAGPHQPVEKVRAALAEALIKGLGRQVTKDQAKKAIQRARQAGLIPPYERGER